MSKKSSATVSKSIKSAIKAKSNTMPQPKNPYTLESNFGLKNKC